MRQQTQHTRRRAQLHKHRPQRGVCGDGEQCARRLVELDLAVHELGGVARVFDALLLVARDRALKRQHRALHLRLVHLRHLSQRT